ncbi:glutathione binding-like protein [Paracoccus rhizosphaerae]|nr:glutathione binding-like protein [Paracoccus rhizosphaerae]
MQWAKRDIPEIDGWLDIRLGQMETILAEREWLVGDRLTLADLVIADVLRVNLVRAYGHRPASEA